MRDGERVRDPNEPEYWWTYHPLEWWARAGCGLDLYGCRVESWIEAGGIRVQHGADPEQTRWFSLDALNTIGGSWQDRSPLTLWLDEIHAYRDRMA